MFAIKSLEGRGRGLVAERHIKAGEIILAEEPLLLTVSQDAKDAACANCLRLLHAGSIACQECRQVAFCSQDCAASAAAKPWVHAAATCRAYSCLSTAPVDDEGRTALRFLIQAMALRALAAQNPADGRYQALMDLDGAPDDTAARQAQQLQPLLAAAIGGLNTSLCAAAPELAALLRKEQLNSYGIMAPTGPDGERRLRGGGVYPRCSLINHECVPNAARFDDFDSQAAAAGGGGGSSGGGGAIASSGGGYPSNTVVGIRAIHDLPLGTEIVQSYFPLNWDLRERQQQAQAVYGFDCRCPRCRTESQPGWQEAAGEDGGSSDWETDDGGEDEEEAEEMEHEGSAKQQQGEQEERQGSEAAVEAISAPDWDDRSPLEATYLQLFMLKYMCPEDSCFGTMAAVLGTDVCECNVCGHRRSEAEFLAELEK